MNLLNTVVFVADNSLFAEHQISLEHLNILVDVFIDCGYLFVNCLFLFFVGLDEVDCVCDSLQVEKVFRFL